MRAGPLWRKIPAGNERLRKFWLPLLISCWLVLSIGTGKSLAAGNTWTSNGPAGGHVYALAIDPHQIQLVFAGTATHGIFKSQDGGEHWQPSNVGLKGLQVLALAISPTTPSTIYAGTSGGIFESSDAGDSWCFGGLEHSPVSVIVTDPMSPRVVYAGTASGVMKTLDGGNSWFLAGLAKTPIVAMAVDPINSTILYASEQGIGVYRSVDGGDHWTSIASGLNRIPISALAIAVEPTASVVYAGGSGGNIYRSENEGHDWVAIPIRISHENVTSICPDPTWPLTIFAGTEKDGVVRTDDRGTTWKMAGLNNITVFTLAIDQSAMPTIYAGTNFQGVFQVDAHHVAKTRN